MVQEMGGVSTAIMILIGITMFVLGTFILFHVGNLIGPHVCYCCMNDRNQSQPSPQDQLSSDRIPSISSSSYDLEYAQMSQSAIHEILPLLESAAI